MNNFITAATFTYPHEIAVIKHLLQEAEISHYFENETMAGIVPFYSQALGGIQLKIHPNDLDNVNYILKSLDPGPDLKIV